MGGGCLVFVEEKPGSKGIAFSESGFWPCKSWRLPKQSRTPRGATVYVDEGIINRDVLPRKSWFLKERPDQVDSTFPGKKILFYAV